jgi:hypothetical protein
MSDGKLLRRMPGPTKEEIAGRRTWRNEKSHEGERMGQVRNAYKIFVGKPERKRKILK